MTTASPSCRAPITNRATTTVSGFGHAATSAKDAKTSPPSTASAHHDQTSCMVSRRRTSSRPSARYQLVVSSIVAVVMGSYSSSREPRSGEAERAVEGCADVRHVEASKETRPGRAAEAIIAGEHGNQRATIVRGEDRLGQERIEHDLADGGAAEEEGLDHRVIGAGAREALLAPFDLQATAAIGGAQGVHLPEPARAGLAGGVEPCQRADEIGFG